jgi:hypothetical protein
MPARDDRGSDKGRVKVRVIEFELDGSNQTLRESIRDIVGAIGGRTQQQLLRAPAAPALNGTTATPAEEGVVIEPEDALDRADEGDEGGSSPRARRSPPRTPQILDLDFNAGDQPLCTLAQGLKLESGSDTDRYTVIAWWLKNHLGIDEITADHVHTGYRHMKWNTPNDAGQPLRSLKTRAYGYMKSGAKPGTFVLTHVGVNHVNDLIKDAGLVS